MLVRNMTNTIDLLKQQQRKIDQDMDKERMWGINSILPTEDAKAKIQAKIEAIRNKLKLGKKLSPANMEFLKANAPELYQKAVKIEQSRKMLKQQIQSSKTKEEVQRIVTTHMTVVRGTEDDVSMEQAALADESSKALKSDKYQKLPATQEERKKRKTDKCCGSYSDDGQQNVEEESGKNFTCEI